MGTLRGLLDLPSFRFGSLLAHLGQMSFWNQRLFYDFLVEMRESGYLGVEEGLNGLDIRRAGFHGIADILEHLPNTGLSVLELVFDSLAIEVREVGDGPHGSEDGIIADPWRPWSEGRHHRDAFLSAEGLKGLVVYVTTL